jgi:hypothetical protein
MERRYHHGNGASAAPGAEAFLHDDLQLLKNVLFRQEGQGWWLPYRRFGKSVNQFIDARVRQGMVNALERLVEDMTPWESAHVWLIAVRHEDPPFVYRFPYQRRAKGHDFVVQHQGRPTCISTLDPIVTCTGYLDHPFKNKHIRTEKDRHSLLANTGGSV